MSDSESAAEWDAGSFGCFSPETEKTLCVQWGPLRRLAGQQQLPWKTGAGACSGALPVRMLNDMTCIVEQAPHQMCMDENGAWNRSGDADTSVSQHVAQAVRRSEPPVFLGAVREDGPATPVPGELLEAMLDDAWLLSPDVEQQKNDEMCVDNVALSQSGHEPSSPTDSTTSTSSSSSSTSGRSCEEKLHCDDASCVALKCDEPCMGRALLKDGFLDLPLTQLSSLDWQIDGDDGPSTASVTDADSGQVNVERARSRSPKLRRRDMFDKCSQSVSAARDTLDVGGAAQAASVLGIGQGGICQWERASCTPMPDPPPGVAHWLEPLWTAMDPHMKGTPLRRVSLESLCSGTAPELHSLEVTHAQGTKCLNKAVYIL